MYACIFRVSPVNCSIHCIIIRLHSIVRRRHLCRPSHPPFTPSIHIRRRQFIRIIPLSSAYFNFFLIRIIPLSMHPHHSTFNSSHSTFNSSHSTFNSSASFHFQFIPFHFQFIRIVPLSIHRIIPLSIHPHRSTFNSAASFHCTPYSCQAAFTPRRRANSSVELSIKSFVNLSVMTVPSMYPSIYPSVYLSMYPSMYPHHMYRLPSLVSASPAGLTPVSPHLSAQPETPLLWSFLTETTPNSLPHEALRLR